MRDSWITDLVLLDGGSRCDLEREDERKERNEGGKEYVRILREGGSFRHE